MATETVRDEIEHRSELAIALVDFDEPLRDARSLEPRELGRQIGMFLNTLSGRMAAVNDAIEGALRCLPNDTDTDAVRSMLTVTAEYDIATNHRFHEFAGLVLAACERGDLVAAEISTKA